MNYTKVFHNAKWLIACKVAQSLLQLIVGMLCARYLGPSNYGLINYASSVVAFALPLMKLGLDSTLVYELIQQPEKEGEILGTSLLMNLLSAVFCMGGVFAFVSVMNRGETQTILVCVLYSLSLVFAAVEMIQYWFQHKLLSKYSGLVMLGSYVAVTVYKVLLLVTGRGVYWFALTNSVDFAIIGFSLLVIYFKKGGMRLTVSFGRAKRLFYNSKHYIFSALMVVVVHNTDHIMITTMLGNEENGYYSAAITCAVVVQFVYTAIIDSFRPLILSAKKEDEAAYRHNMSRLYAIITYLTLAQSVVFAIGAPLLVGVLYGSDYAPSILILRILVWYVTFSVMGTVRNVWILAEQKQKYLWIINLSGALLNIALNAALIPLWGACGAAVASLATQFFANFILGFVIKPLRESNRLLLIGLHPRFVYNEVKHLLLSLRKRT